MKSIFSILFSSILFLITAYSSNAQQGTALNFDGINDYVSLPRTISDNFTIEYWIKTTQVGPSGSQWYLGNGIVDAEVGGVRNDFGTSLVGNKLAFGIGNPDITIFSTSNVNTGNWVHVAVSREKVSGDIKLYINGNLEASAKAPNINSLTSSGQIVLGALQTGFLFLSGSIDELRFWNRVLTLSEIQGQMNCELFYSIQSGLSGYYKFNQGLAAGANSAINTLYDSSSNNINGTLFNFMLSGITSNWITPGAVQNGNYCALPLYSFIGNGNWSDPINWSNNKIPPMILPGGSEIIINPADGGEAILDRAQHISAKAKLTVQQNKKFIIPGNLDNYDKPIANFNFTTTSLEFLPVTITTTNTSIGFNASYSWSFGNGNTFTTQNPTNDFNSGGIYDIKLGVTNPIGSDFVIKQVKILPYPQVYINFNGIAMNLFAWEGNKVMILSRNNNLNRVAMFKWLKAMDTTYGYYKNCTGREPSINPPTYVNNKTTIADVTNTCGAGCGYLGATGIELQNTYFDVMYNSINNNNQYDQAVFYEFGRNFWFYGNQLSYKTNDPITTGYAVFMRFMAIEAAGVDGAPFGTWSFPTFRSNVENLINTYLADASLNWANTLGIGQGIPGSGLGATDLFASFCFRLRRDYGGGTFVQNVWKKAGLRPNANTTQDAVDNFFLASCAAANKNLTTLFQSWKWTLSASAITAALQYP